MKTDYKKAYDDLTVRDRLHEKLMDIPMGKRSVGKVFFKIAVTAMSVFIILFSTDMISYAVTGEGVAERVQKTISEPKGVNVKSVELNGKRLENFVVSDSGVEFYDPLRGHCGIIIDDTMEHIVIEMLPTFFVRDEEDDRVIAVVGDEYLHIDITEDIKDEYASGEFEAEGKTYHYDVVVYPEYLRYSIFDKGYRWNIYEVEE